MSLAVYFTSLVRSSQAIAPCHNGRETQRSVNSNMIQIKSSMLLLISLSTLLGCCQPVRALPPADDPPEEVLRTEIILDGRSGFDGRPLTATEYIQEQERVSESPYPPELSSDVQYAVFLLQVRRLLKPIIPFIP